MAISIGVSAKGRTVSGAGITSSSVTSAASGSAFVLAVIYDASVTFTSVGDSKSNVYTQIGTTQSYGTSGRARLYYKENGVGGASHTFSLVTSGSGACTIFGIEILGGALSGILDQSSNRADTASPFTLAAGLTTTQANEALLTFLAGDSGSNPSTHAETGLGSSTVQIQETDGTQFYTGAVATALKTATGTFNPSWTETGAVNGAVFLATFKEATASGAITGATAMALSGTGALSGAGALAGVATATFTPTAVLRGAGALAGASALSLSASGVVTGAGALAGSTALSITPTATLQGAGAMAGVSALTFTPVGAFSGSAPLVGSAALTFAPIGVLKGTGALIGNAALSFTMSAVFGTFVTGSAQVIFSATGTLRGTGVLSGTSSLALSASGSLSGVSDGSLVGSAAFAFHALGVLSGYRASQTPRARTIVIGRERRIAIEAKAHRVAVEPRSRRTVH